MLIDVRFAKTRLRRVGSYGGLISESSSHNYAHKPSSSRSGPNEPVVLLREECCNDSLTGRIRQSPVVLNQCTTVWSYPIPGPLPEASVPLPRGFPETWLTKPSVRRTTDRFLFTDKPPWPSTSMICCIKEVPIREQHLSANF